MEKSWKIIGNKIWQQTRLWWWWEIHKNKIKAYGDSAITNLYGKKIPKEKASCKCLSIIMLDSVIEAKKK